MSNTPVTINSIKREAKRLAKAQSIPLHKSLDQAAREYGFQAWSHLQRELDNMPMPLLNRVTFLHVPDIARMPMVALSDKVQCLTARMFLDNLVQSARNNTLSGFNEPYLKAQQFIVMNVEDLMQKTMGSCYLKEIVLRRGNVILISASPPDVILSNSECNSDLRYLLT